MQQASPKQFKEKYSVCESLLTRRNCSEENEFVTEISTLKRRFLKRGYPEDWIETAVSKASKRKREEILFEKSTTKVQKEDKDRNQCRMITTFSRQQERLKSIMNKHWHVIKNDPVLGKVVTRRPQITFRKVKSFQQALVRYLKKSAA